MGTNELIYFGLRERLLPCWARARLSPKAIVSVKDGWLDEYEAWQKRDLSAKRYVYVWAHVIYLQARLEDEKQCILVLIGATPEMPKMFFKDAKRCDEKV